VNYLFRTRVALEYPIQLFQIFNWKYHHVALSRKLSPTLRGTGHTHCSIQQFLKYEWKHLAPQTITNSYPEIKSNFAWHRTYSSQYTTVFEHVLCNIPHPTKDFLTCSSQHTPTLNLQLKFSLMRFYATFIEENADFFWTAQFSAWITV
jgi:hypothetical protein